MALVLLLHVFIVAALLQATLQKAPATEQAREILFWFLPPPKPQKHELPKKKNQLPLAPRIAPMRSVPDYRTITLPPPPSPESESTSLQDLQLPLFGCAPETLDRLSPEARAKCPPLGAPSKPDDSVDYADHTNKSREAERWARGKARKKAPLLLPCANSENIVMTVLGALPCLANSAVNGFDLDAAPGYSDKPSQSHLPNNGDPPPVYKDPGH